MEELRYLLSGDNAITVEFGNEISPAVNEKIRAFNYALQSAEINGIVETVPTYRSVLVIYRPEIIRFSKLVEELKAVEEKAADIKLPPALVTEIPVFYGGDEGPDLKDMADLAGLTEEEVISIHSSNDYLIYMLGFLAGFPYLGGLDGRIAAPRLTTPRVRIEAGSVGIAGEQTGIYPIESPGGWRIIGRTPVRLYDPEREDPVLLKAGDYLRFRPVSREEYRDIEKHVEDGSYRVFMTGKEEAR